MSRDKVTYEQAVKQALENIVEDYVKRLESAKEAMEFDASKIEPAKRNPFYQVPQNRKQKRMLMHGR